MIPHVVIDDSLESILKSIEHAKSQPRLGFKKSSLLIVSWNVNLLKKALSRDQFYNFISENSPDILCFEETKISTSEQPRYKAMLPQFQYQYWSCCEESAHFAGVALLSKAEAHSVRHGTGSPNSIGRVLTVEFENFYVIVCYCPLSMTETKQILRAQWDEELRNHISELKQNKGIIILGDFNICYEEIDVLGYPIDTIPPGCSILERESFRKNLDLGFVDSFRFFYPDTQRYSWRSIRMPGCPVARLWKSRIDYVLVSTSLLPKLKDAFIFDNYKAVSDHCPVGISLEII